MSKNKINYAYLHDRGLFLDFFQIPIHELKYLPFSAFDFINVHNTFTNYLSVSAFKGTLYSKISSDHPCKAGKCPIYNCLIPLKPLPEMEFKEFEPRFKSAKTRFKLSAGLNLETFDTILSGTNHILTAA